MIIHVAEQGETLASVARRYRVSPKRLGQENGVLENEGLAAGQALAVLFPAQVHTVQKGETLYGIARRYGISLRQLYRNNPGAAAQPYLYPGDRLVIRYRQNKLGRIESSGYAYPSTPRELLRAALPYMTQALPFTHELTRGGTLAPLADEAVLEEARSLGTAAVMSVSNLREPDGFDSSTAHLVLNSPELQQSLIQDIQKEISQKGYAGVDIDFEYLYQRDREKYPRFLRRLKEALGPSLLVRAAVAAKTADGAGGRLVEGLDYRAIGEAADAVLLMTYEWGYALGAPMAVAPLYKVREVLDYATARIPREKLLMGVPNYGYDWPLGGGRARSVSNVEAVRLARSHGEEILYDQEAQAPWFRYRHEGQEREVWFEDARSIRAKLRLAAEFGLRGMGVWNLSRPFPQGWTVLNALFRLEE